MTQKRRIPVLPGVDDPMVSAAIAKDYRAKSPMEQALCRKKMAEWLIANAGQSKDEAERSVVKWVNALLANNPNTKYHYAKLVLKSKLRLFGGWMRYVAWRWLVRAALLVFYAPAIGWWHLILLKRKVMSK